MEKYTGIPYAWGIYRIVVLPPNFPYGGMENPLLTLVTPYILVGDKSGVTVANHEIAHSWTGNLVTNMNWDNFWLNEGFTVFLERKISKILNNDTFVKIDARNGNSSMYQAMLGYGLTNKYSSLNPRSGKENPDDAFSTIPYEKGYQFLLYLESLDGETNFQKFFTNYLFRFQKQSVDVEDLRVFWETHIRNSYSKTQANTIIGKVDWSVWIDQPGLPPVTANFTTKEEIDTNNLADSYINGQTPTNPERYKTWPINQKQMFLNRLLSNVTKLDAAKVSKINNDLTPMCCPAVGKLQNLWLLIGIQTGFMTTPFADADLYLSNHGALSNAKLYSEIKKKNAADALRIFDKYKNWYHPITKDLCEKALA